MPRDYIGNGNGTDRGLDITPKLSTLQSSLSSLDTRHDSNSRLLGSSSAASNSINTTAVTNNNTDLVWYNKATGQNAAWLMNGTTLSSAQYLPYTGDLNWKMQGTGDFNGDNNTDIVWRNYATGENAVWLMNGTSFSQSVYLPSLPDLNWKIETTGDFNNDSKTDIVWRNYATGQNALWLMNGTNLLNGLYIQSVNDTNWHIEGTGDFNNDNRVDLLWRDYNTGQNAVWLMGGTNILQGVFIEGVTDTNWAIAGTGNFHILFSDNFDSENNGIASNSTFNYNRFAQWDVSNGTVDLQGNGFGDYYPGNGLYVDLDGSTNKAGLFSTKKIFALSPGTYELTFELGNNPYANPSNTVTINLANVYTESFTVTGSPPLTRYSRTINVLSPTSGKLSFQNNGGDNGGAILDDVQLSRIG